MMAATAQSSRVPDLVLQRVGGGEINPSALIGQELVVIFLPWLEDQAQAQRAAGASFLFTRSGCFERSWAESGHAGEVLEEARRRN